MTSMLRGIHLGHTLEAHGQAGAEIENLLFDLLSADMRAERCLENTVATEVSWLVLMNTGSCPFPDVCR